MENDEVTLEDEDSLEDEVTDEDVREVRVRLEDPFELGVMFGLGFLIAMTVWGALWLFAVKLIVDAVLTP